MLPENMQKLPSAESFKQNSKTKEEFCYITMENDGHQFIMLECDLVVVHRIMIFFSKCDFLKFENNSSLTQVMSDIYIYIYIKQSHNYEQYLIFCV